MIILDRMRAAAADIVAMVIYCFITGMITEVLISGMSLQNSLSSRLLAIPVNMIIAWPYGLWRDWLLKHAASLTASNWLRPLADMLAYVSFQSPVYALILVCIGADREQIIAAVSANILSSLLLGGVYGWFLDYCRRLLGTPQMKAA